jgi:hypothetical protein
MLTYAPNVCRQTDTEHTHYDIALEVPLNTNQIQALHDIAARVGGQTAGQVIQRILELRETGIDLHQYGIILMNVTTLPLYQHCVKGLAESPVIDWDYRLTPGDTVPQPPPEHVWVGHVRHR